MRLTKRQLKRIIREEYSRLRSRGLIKEMYEEYYPEDEFDAYEHVENTMGDGSPDAPGMYDGLTEDQIDQVLDVLDEMREEEERRHGYRDEMMDYDPSPMTNYDSFGFATSRPGGHMGESRRRRRTLRESIGSTVLVEIEELLLDELGDDIDAKISMAKAVALIKSNMPYVMKGQSAKDIEDFIYSHNDFYHDIVIDPISRSVMLKQIFDDDDETISSPYHYSDSPIHRGSVGVKAGRNPFPGEY